MTRKPLRMLIALTALSLMSAGTEMTRAEEEIEVPAAEAVAAGSSGAADTITRIMEDNEALLSGRGFSYDPAGRRDPFRSLVDPLNSPHTGPRPRGIAGMLISEVDLVGIVQKGKGYIAFFNGSDNKGYFLKVGDTLYDGKIVKIDRRTGMVRFRQDVNDPRSIKPYRDVTKRLALAEEERL